MTQQSDYALGQQIGRLAQAVEALTARLESLERDVRDFRDVYSRGRGFIVGAAFVVGFALYGLKDWLLGIIKP